MNSIAVRRTLTIFCFLSLLVLGAGAAGAQSSLKMGKLMRTEPVIILSFGPAHSSIYGLNIATDHGKITNPSYRNKSNKKCLSTKCRRHPCAAKRASNYKCANKKNAL